MTKLLCAILLLAACQRAPQSTQKQWAEWCTDSPSLSDLSQHKPPCKKLDAGISPEVQALTAKLDQCSKLAADTTADFLRHMRTDHLEKEPMDELADIWPFEWPDKWVRIDMVCPTAKYSSKCRTTDWFRKHPEAITSDGKMKEPHARSRD